MKKNSLTTAVVAGIAGFTGFTGVAQAVNLNPDGLGAALVYPYYTVNKNQDTLLSVVNTSDIGKAVKVRFLEGYNSRDVLDFNLFLSAHDVWTAALTQVGDEDGAQIVTFDSSCVDTIPAWDSQNPDANEPWPFSSDAYAGDAADGGPEDLTRTREGHVEMLLMGDIIPGTALDQAITHEKGVPSCASPVGGNPDAISGDLAAPSGGLFGSGVIINVGAGTFFSYNADAVDGWSDAVQYTDSTSLTPSLGSANNAVSDLTARARVFTTGGQLLTADYERGEDAVSAVFMADSVYNEYWIDSAYGAASDWVVTLPTKRFYVDKDLYPGAVTQPFAVPFTGTSDVEFVFDSYDREERVAHGASFANLPYEVNVLTFTNDTVDESTVFGSRLFSTMAPNGLVGWASLNLAAGDGGAHALEGGVTPSGADVVIPGLPVTGFYANNVINANATPGKLANYSGVWRHRANRSCAGTDVACS